MQTILVGLYCQTQLKDLVECETISEARALIHRPMAPGWAYRLEYGQFEPRYSPATAELERELGLTPICECI